MSIEEFNQKWVHLGVTIKEDLWHDHHTNFDLYDANNKIFGAATSIDRADADMGRMYYSHTALAERLDARTNG